MKFTDFRQFRSQVFEQYHLGEFEKLLALLDQHVDKFPEQQANTTFWRICMLALLNREGEAIDTLHQAIDQGLWWSAKSLRDDPDLGSLQGEPRFENLIALCQDRHARALEKSKPELLILAPKASAPTPYPLLLAFHGRNSNAFDFAAHWEGLIRAGWIVALAQSSQIINPNAYGWDDFSLAVSEASARYNALLAKLPIDPKRTVLAGFSQGAGLVAWLAVSRKVSAKGFISVAPYLGSIDALISTLPEGPITGVRGYLVTGGNDHHIEMFSKVVKMLAAHYIPFQIENHPQLGHDFPLNFTQSLERALDFILDEDT